MNHFRMRYHYYGYLVGTLMIWNESILFVHAPKTAGMSMTSMLCEHLRGAVRVTGPYEAQSGEGRLKYMPGKRHETLSDADSFFAERNIRLAQFERIFVVMRSPYDLELSRFAYLQKDLPQDRGKAQKIALEGDFRRYLATAPFFGMNPPRLDLYYHVDGNIPDNLVILRYEQLAHDIERHIAPYLSANYQVPYENQSNHESVDQVYDAELEALCYQRHKWFFDNGFYARVSYPPADAVAVSGTL